MRNLASIVAGLLFGGLILSTAAPIRSADAQSDNPAAARCGSVDLVLVMDTTFSLTGSINEMKRQAQDILNVLYRVSGGEFRIGLVSFDDTVTVRLDLDALPDIETKVDLVKSEINRLSAYGGRSGPEASDEAVNAAVNGLSASGRQQVGDFNGDWIADSRILVLITDNKPGGFDDTFTKGIDDLNAFRVALAAQRKNIHISAIYVPTSGSHFGVDPEVSSIMRTYATETGGLYVETGTHGTGTAAAVASIVETCGENQLF